MRGLDLFIEFVASSRRGVDLARGVFDTDDEYTREYVLEAARRYSAKHTVGDIPCTSCIELVRPCDLVDKPPRTTPVPECQHVCNRDVICIKCAHRDHGLEPDEILVRAHPCGFCPKLVHLTFKRGERIPWFSLATTRSVRGQAKNRPHTYFIPVSNTQISKRYSVHVFSIDIEHGYERVVCSSCVSKQPLWKATRACSELVAKHLHLRFIAAAKRKHDELEQAEKVQSERRSLPRAAKKHARYK